MYLQKIKEKFKKENENSDFISAITLDESSFLVAFQDGNNLRYGSVVLAKIINGDIVFGDKIIFNESITMDIHAMTVNKGTFVISYKDFIEINNETIAIGTITGDSISFYRKNIF